MAGGGRRPAVSGLWFVAAIPLIAALLLLAGRSLAQDAAVGSADVTAAAAVQRVEAMVGAVRASCPAVSISGSRTVGCPVADWNPDGDLRRQAGDRPAPGLCQASLSIEDGSAAFRFTLLVGKPNPLVWFVIHDDEDAAFDVALAGVGTHGGTVMALENFERRPMADGSDPNMVFPNHRRRDGRCTPQAQGINPGLACALGAIARGRIGISLHNNAAGHASQGGAGNLSRRRLPAGYALVEAPAGVPAVGGEDELVLLFDRGEARNPLNDQLAATLAQDGLAVARKSVTADNYDCSMSDYMVSHGVDFVTIEAGDGEADIQTFMADKVIDAIERFRGGR